ncbi:hypothetical protein Poli38472_012535 [Pythium oligandrum]|uniref:Enoyl reductase (ER) domain-containing protein n=1 Tax=Pythium oligandrum TaxID=41045 RepID=A0A8K1CDD4_PYTOL|nr:hypothetical protein Poli38472_012535 [Pythium oligandrum]|eukprot:TMW61344.1 hypothetical protein Poli38472_012535 [Pythium oligandrum]
MSAPSSVSTTFRGYVAEGFGSFQDNLKFRSDLPQEPLQPTQVRIKIHSAATNPVDSAVVEVGPFFYPTRPTAEKPLRLGFDGAGSIAEVGSEVTDFQVGDDVVVLTDFAVTGTFAEYLTLDAEFVVHKPKSLSLHEAAGLPLVGISSYQALLAGKVSAGDRVLIIGGSSATGAVGIQLAKELGASFVATTASMRNIDFVKSFGPDQVIDYTQEKWGDVLEPHSIDVIYDCGMEATSWEGDAQRVLKKETGRFITIDPRYQPTNESPIGAAFTRFMGRTDKGHLEFLVKLAGEGKLKVPIDSVFSFEDLLKAIGRQMSHKARGKIILDVDSAQNP